MSFVDELKARTTQVEKPEDPWLAVLRKIRGDIGLFDKREIIPTQRVLELLGVPPGQRKPPATTRLRKIMVQLRWEPIRARQPTSKSGSGAMRDRRLRSAPSASDVAASSSEKRSHDRTPSPPPESPRAVEHLPLPPAKPSDLGPAQWCLMRRSRGCPGFC